MLPSDWLPRQKLEVAPVYCAHTRPPTRPKADRPPNTLEGPIAVDPIVADPIAEDPTTAGDPVAEDQRSTATVLLEPIQLWLRQIGELGIFSGRAFVALVSPPYEIPLWLRQMDQLGVRSIAVASITTIFTGMVLALQTAYSLPELGVKYYIGTVVSKSLTRELGPVLVALVVGGRIGAGMTAELGTMKVTEQVDALRSMAADPIKKLVAPKLAATLIMLPALTLIGDFLGVLGGALIAVYQLNVSLGLYANDVLQALTLSDIASGVGKSFFFAYFIAIIGCFNGLGAKGGADGVGRSTTNTVVWASIMVLVSDFFLTKLFYILGSLT